MADALTCYMWLTIGLSPCNPRKWDILGSYDSISSFYKNLKLDKRITVDELRSLSSAAFSQAEAIIEYCNKKNINVYCPEDSAYPEKLKLIKNPPSVLFAMGRLEDLNFTKSAAIVGSREADEYSLECTNRISRELSEKGVLIVSGMARGIDQAAHMGAISAGGPTVAVLGCGLEYDYPKNSHNIKSAISKHGAVISEYFPATKPRPENFKIRNRICSALSDCIICTQASSRSGALNTVSHAIEQGKEIFVTPPHDIFSEDYQGIIALLKDGAEQIYSASDILMKMY